MSTVLWSRTAAVRARFARTALAQYGAGLHTDCDDCAVDSEDVVVPVPRTPGSRSISRRLTTERL